MIRSTLRPDGGMDIAVILTPEEVAAIGAAQAEGIADWFDTALWGLAMLRTGQICRDEGPGATEVQAAEMDTVIRDLDAKLLPRLAGIRDAAIRRHRELGGSVGALAAAMDVARSTAQTRREALEAPGPRGVSSRAWQEWATTPQQQD
ncbi:hypothetical protein QA942_39740 [Streptomyces sp. B21-106]|uniref:hypothetical protein n=1 Tax=Streptomyces sp. B21-106 TaxID=3039418 RepID=UPI002FF42A29